MPQKKSPLQSAPTIGELLTKKKAPGLPQEKKAAPVRPPAKMGQTIGEKLSAASSYRKPPKAAEPEVIEPKASTRAERDLARKAIESERSERERDRYIDAPKVKGGYQYSFWTGKNQHNIVYPGRLKQWQLDSVAHELSKTIGVTTTLDRRASFSQMVEAIKDTDLNIIELRLMEEDAEEDAQKEAKKEAKKKGAASAKFDVDRRTPEQRAKGRYIALRYLREFQFDPATAVSRLEDEGYLDYTGPAKKKSQDLSLKAWMQYEGGTGKPSDRATKLSELVPQWELELQDFTNKRLRGPIADAVRKLSTSELAVIAGGSIATGGPIAFALDRGISASQKAIEDLVSQNVDLEGFAGVNSDFVRFAIKDAAQDEYFQRVTSAGANVATGLKGGIADQLADSVNFFSGHAAGLFASGVTMTGQAEDAVTKMATGQQSATLEEVMNLVALPLSALGTAGSVAKFFGKDLAAQFPAWAAAVAAQEKAAAKVVPWLASQPHRAAKQIVRAMNAVSPRYAAKLNQKFFEGDKAYKAIKEAFFPNDSPLNIDEMAKVDPEFEKLRLIRDAYIRDAAPAVSRVMNRALVNARAMFKDVDGLINMRKLLLVSARTAGIETEAGRMAAEEAEKIAERLRYFAGKDNPWYSLLDPWEKEVVGAHLAQTREVLNEIPYFHGDEEKLNMALTVTQNMAAAAVAGGHDPGPVVYQSVLRILSGGEGEVFHQVEDMIRGIDSLTNMALKYGTTDDSVVLPAIAREIEEKVAGSVPSKPLFGPKGVELLTTEEIADHVYKHKLVELQAAFESIPKNVLDEWRFYTDEMDKLNEVFDSFVRSHHGRTPNDWETRLMHTLSAFGSPSNSPSADTRIGFALWDTIIRGPGEFRKLVSDMSIGKPSTAYSAGALERLHTLVDYHLFQLLKAGDGYSIAPRVGDDVAIERIQDAIAALTGAWAKETRADPASGPGQFIDHILGDGYAQKFYDIESPTSDAVNRVLADALRKGDLDHLFRLNQGLSNENLYHLALQRALSDLARPMDEALFKKLDLIMDSGDITGRNLPDKQKWNRKHEYMGAVGDGFRPARGKTLGVFLLGDMFAKVGPYALSRWGSAFGLDMVVKDLWFARDVSRLFGLGLVKTSEKTGKESVVKEMINPSSKRRTEVRAAFDEGYRRVARELGMTPGEVQALTWALERHLYALGGAKIPGGSLLEGAADARAFLTGERGNRATLNVNKPEARGPDTVIDVVGKKGKIKQVSVPATRPAWLARTPHGMANPYLARPDATGDVVAVAPFRLKSYQTITDKWGVGRMVKTDDKGNIIPNASRSYAAGDVRYLLKSAGVSPEEVRYTGLDEYLARAQLDGRKLTQDEVLDVIEASPAYSIKVSRADGFTDHDLKARFTEYTLAPEGHPESGFRTYLYRGDRSAYQESHWPGQQGVYTHVRVWTGDVGGHYTVAEVQAKAHADRAKAARKLQEAGRKADPDRDLPHPELPGRDLAWFSQAVRDQLRIAATEGYSTFRWEDGMAQARRWHEVVQVRARFDESGDLVITQLNPALTEEENAVSGWRVGDKVRNIPGVADEELEQLRTWKELQFPDGVPERGFYFDLPSKHFYNLMDKNFTAIVREEMAKIGVDAKISRTGTRNGIYSVKIPPELAKHYAFEGIFFEKIGAASGTGLANGLYSMRENMIKLSSTADFETWLHENGHRLRALVDKLGGEDAKLLNELYGAVDSTEGQERFVRDMLGYWRTGDAPAPRFRGMYDAVKSILGDARDTIPDLDPRVKRILDSYLAATDEPGLKAKPSGALKKLRSIVEPIFSNRMGIGAAKLKDFAHNSIEGILKKSDWVIISAENPNATTLPPADNAARTQALRDQLDQMGYKYKEVIGRYSDTGGPPETSFVVTGIDEATAQKLGREHGQEAIVTNKGLVFQDGSYHPATGVTKFDEAPENYYSEIDGKPFRVDIDFDTKIPPAGAADEFADTAGGTGMPATGRDVGSTPTPSTKLTHYGPKGLTETDPSRMGSGLAARQEEYLNQVKGTWFYGEGMKHEHKVMRLYSGPEHAVYETEVPSDKIYHVGEDPLGLVKETGDEIGVVSGPTLLDAVNAKLRDMGYWGIKNDTRVMVWEKLPLKEKAAGEFAEKATTFYEVRNDMFHGSTKDFNKLDQSQSRTSGIIFLSPDESFASSYGKTRKVTIDAKKTFDVRDRFEFESFIDKAGSSPEVQSSLLRLAVELEDGWDEVHYEAYGLTPAEELSRPITADDIFDRVDLYDQNWYIGEFPGFADYLRTKGYDSIKMAEQGSETWAILDPSIIKGEQHLLFEKAGERPMLPKADDFPDYTGLANKIREYEEERGIAVAAMPKDPEDMQSAFDRAKKLVDSGETDPEEMAAALAAGDTTFKGAEDVYVLQYHTAKLEKDLRVLRSEIDKASAAKQDTSGLVLEYLQKRTKLERFLQNVQVAKGVWSEVGRALNSAVGLDLGDLQQVVREVEMLYRYANGQTPPRVLKNLKQAVREVNRARSAGATADAVLTRTKAEEALKAILLAAGDKEGVQIASKIKGATRVITVEEADLAITEAKGRLSSAIKRALSGQKSAGMNVTGLGRFISSAPEVAGALGELVIAEVNKLRSQGMVKRLELNSNVYAAAKKRVLDALKEEGVAEQLGLSKYGDITDENIDNILASYYDDVTEVSSTGEAEKLAKTTSEIESLINDAERSIESGDLKGATKKLTQAYRKATGPEDKWDKVRMKLRSEIVELQRQIDAGKMDEKVKADIAAAVEPEDITKLREERAALSTRLRDIVDNAKRTAKLEEKNEAKAARALKTAREKTLDKARRGEESAEAIRRRELERGAAEQEGSERNLAAAEKKRQAAAAVAEERRLTQEAAAEQRRIIAEAKEEQRRLLAEANATRKKLESEAAADSKKVADVLAKAKRGEELADKIRKTELERAAKKQADAEKRLAALEKALKEFDDHPANSVPPEPGTYSYRGPEEGWSEALTPSDGYQVVIRNKRGVDMPGEGQTVTVNDDGSETITMWLPDKQSAIDVATAADRATVYSWADRADVDVMPDGLKPSMSAHTGGTVNSNKARIAELKRTLDLKARAKRYQEVAAGKRPAKKRAPRVRAANDEQRKAMADIARARAQIHSQMKLAEETAAGRLLREFQGVAKALNATMDVSWLRQGWAMALANPKRGAEAYVKSWAGALSKSNAIRYAEHINRNGEMYKRAGLHLYATPGVDEMVTGTFDGVHFDSSGTILGHIPVVKKAFEFSDTHYGLGLNILRTTAFDAAVMAKPGMTDDELKALARAINLWTGRGYEAGHGTADKILNTAFFSSRNMVANIRQILLSPFEIGHAAMKYGISSPVTRLHAKLAAARYTWLMAVYLGANMALAPRKEKVAAINSVIKDPGSDPRDVEAAKRELDKLEKEPPPFRVGTDGREWGQIQSSRLDYDPTFGHMSYLRYFKDIATGFMRHLTGDYDEYTTGTKEHAAGDPKSPFTANDFAQRSMSLLWYKTAPSLHFAGQAVTSETIMGEPLGEGGLTMFKDPKMYEMFLPFFFQGTWDVLTDGGNSKPALDVERTLAIIAMAHGMDIKPQRYEYSRAGKGR